MTRKVWTAKDVEQIFMIAQDVVSLDMRISPNDSESDTELHDFIEDPSPTPEEEALIADRHDALMQYMTKFLTPREQNVIVLRFGLDRGTPLTLREIGEELGLTRERVRQLEKNALRKLRICFARNNITVEDI